MHTFEYSLESNFGQEEGVTHLRTGRNMHRKWNKGNMTSLPYMCSTFSAPCSTKFCNAIDALLNLINILLISLGSFRFWQYFLEKFNLKMILLFIGIKLIICLNTVIKSYNVLFQYWTRTWTGEAATKTDWIGDQLLKMLRTSYTRNYYILDYIWEMPLLTLLMLLICWRKRIIEQWQRNIYSLQGFSQNVLR